MVHGLNNMSSLLNNNNPESAATIIDGKAIAAEIRAEIGARIRQSSASLPGLAVVLVGSRRDSLTYVNMKKKACAEAGIKSQGFDFSESVSQQEILDCVHHLNNDPSIHGILIQLPLPAHLDPNVILQAVDPMKDVDGLHPVNVANLQLYHGRSALDAPFSIPCTPLGCLVLLERSGVELKGKHVVVLGRSNLVGLPMARLLLGCDATVTVCHSKTNNIASVCRTADVIIAAVGKPLLVKGDWIKPGAVIIDVGINSVDNLQGTNGKSYKLVGDVDFDAAKLVASKITPVPGGVGPMTIAMLLNNTLRACELANQNNDKKKMEQQ